MTTFFTSPVGLVVLGVAIVLLATRELFKWLIVRTAINDIDDATGRAAVLHELPPLFGGGWTLGPFTRLSRTLGRGELPDQDTEPSAEQESTHTTDDDAQDNQGDDDHDLPPDSSATS